MASAVSITAGKETDVLRNTPRVKFVLNQNNTTRGCQEGLFPYCSAIVHVLRPRRHVDSDHRRQVGLMRSPFLILGVPFVSPLPLSVLYVQIEMDA